MLLIEDQIEEYFIKIKKQDTEGIVYRMNSNDF